MKKMFNQIIPLSLVILVLFSSVVSGVNYNPPIPDIQTVEVDMMIEEPSFLDSLISFSITGVSDTYNLGDDIVVTDTLTPPSVWLGGCIQPKYKWQIKAVGDTPFFEAGRSEDISTFWINLNTKKDISWNSGDHGATPYNLGQYKLTTWVQCANDQIHSYYYDEKSFAVGQVTCVESLLSTTCDSNYFIENFHCAGQIKQSYDKITLECVNNELVTRSCLEKVEITCTNQELIYTQCGEETGRVLLPSNVECENGNPVTVEYGEWCVGLGLGGAKQCVEQGSPGYAGRFSIGDCFGEGEEGFRKCSEALILANPCKDKNPPEITKSCKDGTLEEFARWVPDITRTKCLADYDLTKCPSNQCNAGGTDCLIETGNVWSLKEGKCFQGAVTNVDKTFKGDDAEKDCNAAIDIISKIGNWVHDEWGLFKSIKNKSLGTYVLVGLACLVLFGGKI